MKKNIRDYAIECKSKEDKFDVFKYLMSIDEPVSEHIKELSVDIEYPYIYFSEVKTWSSYMDETVVATNFVKEIITFQQFKEMFMKDKEKYEIVCEKCKEVLCSGYIDENGKANPYGDLICECGGTSVRIRIALSGKTLYNSTYEFNFNPKCDNLAYDVSSNPNLFGCVTYKEEWKPTHIVKFAMSCEFIGDPNSKYYKSNIICSNNVEVVVIDTNDIQSVAKNKDGGFYIVDNKNLTPIKPTNWIDKIYNKYR